MSIVAQATEYGPIVAQYGFGGAVLWILVKWMESITKWMERIDHTLRGLSKAMWMDLASRPTADAIIQAHAKQMIAKMDAEKESP